MTDGWAALAVLVASSPLLAAALAIVTRRNSADTAISLLGALGSIVLIARVVIDGPVDVADGWFVVDRVAAVWTVFALVVVVAIRTFARRLLAGDPERERFHLASAAAATSGVALFAAADLLVLAATAAVSSVASAAVIGSRRESMPVARRMAAVLLGGDALLLAAVLILAADSARTDPVALSRADGAVVHVVAVLVVAAALVRCSQVPAQGWLPRTLVAPTPASALLHAGLVNAGGVLLIRFAPLVVRSLPATILGLGLATASMIVGAAVMRSRSEVKSTLVWSTTAQMGFMLVQVLVGLGAAAAAHLVAHGAYKSSLFLLSGSTLEHEPHPHPRLGRSDVVIASLAAAVVVALAVLLVGYDLAGADGAAVMVPLFAVLTVAAAMSARAPLRRPATLALVGVLAASTVAYLGLIDWFKSWLDLPDAVPEAAGVLAVAVAVVTVLGTVAASFPQVLPGRVATRVRARVLAIGRRPVLEVVSMSATPDFDRERIAASTT